MRFGLVLMAAVVLASAQPLLAQDTSEVRETRCWLGSVTFSAGASMNIGGNLAVCEADSGWQEMNTSGEAAGCLLEGELSSVGAVVGISNNDRFSLQCGPDGHWATLDNQAPLSTE